MPEQITSSSYKKKSNSHPLGGHAWHEHLLAHSCRTCTAVKNHLHVNKYKSSYIMTTLSWAGVIAIRALDWYPQKEPAPGSARIKVAIGFGDVSAQRVHAEIYRDIERKKDYIYVGDSPYSYTTEYVLPVGGMQAILAEPMESEFLPCT